ncbi:hypothetical protein BC628DRAFT_120695 [Trametes gibbosa]|nr:hypothetical protein BC628DRAFT_120695 [Trametes gibbosa]
MSCGSSTGGCMAFNSSQSSSTRGSLHKRASASYRWPSKAVHAKDLTEQEEKEGAGSARRPLPSTLCPILWPRILSTHPRSPSPSYHQRRSAQTRTKHENMYTLPNHGSFAHPSRPAGMSRTPF